MQYHFVYSLYTAELEERVNQLAASGWEFVSLVPTLNAYIVVMRKGGGADKTPPLQETYPHNTA